MDHRNKQLQIMSSLRRIWNCSSWSRRNRFKRPWSCC